MRNAISLIQDLSCVVVSISYDDNHYTTGTLWKSNEVNDVKRRLQKNIQKKAVQTKLNLYINKNINMKHYKTLRIS